MSNANNHGGARPGAGRPRKGDARRVSITFSVDSGTAQKAREIRGNGGDVNSIVEAAICKQHDLIFNCK